MSYTPFARWRNFTLENLKSMLALYPDMLERTSRDDVADSIEEDFPGYKRTAYQFGCQLGIESRAAFFSKQNYLYFLSDEGLKNYLGFWFKMYVCPNPYVQSADTPICPFQVIAKKVLEAPDRTLSYTQFCDEAFGAGKSIDIFKNALATWGKPLNVVGDVISIDSDKVDELKEVLHKVEQTLPMKNNKDVDEFFDRFSCERFMSFYDLTTIDGYSKDRTHDESDVFAGFDPWLTSYDNPDYTGTEKYTGYVDALEKLIKYMAEKNIIEDDNLNEINLEKYNGVLEAYNESLEAQEYDKIHIHHKRGRAALKKYIKYIAYLIAPHSVKFDYLITKGNSVNKIFFGMPGCGKSYHIEHDILGKDNSTKEYVGDYSKERVIRTTFYQDYSNTDFVGQILPKIVKGENGEKDVVEYIFNPGPFTLALIQAISNPTKKVALVIEEINRGNAPAIFGDIFQLLDRDGNSISEYGIVNVGMMDYLNAYEFTVDGEKKRYAFSEIKLPGNMDIFATMNTSDQNVYTLDTAFVRRWDKEKIKNSFKNCKFKDMPVPGMSQYTWEEFVTSINNCIAKHLEDLQVNEDKQIGAFFVKASLLADNDAEKFAYKVFDYLWSDVAKLDHGIFFNPYDTLENLIDAYKTNGVGVFKTGIFEARAAISAEEEENNE